MTTVTSFCKPYRKASVELPGLAIVDDLAGDALVFDRARVILANELAGRNALDRHALDDDVVRVADGERRAWPRLIAPRATERAQCIEGGLEVAGVDRLRYAAFGSIAHVGPQVLDDLAKARTDADVFPQII